MKLNPHHYSIDHAPVKRISVLIFFIFLITLLLYVFFHEKQEQTEEAYISLASDKNSEDVSKWNELVASMKKTADSKYWNAPEVTGFLQHATPIILKTCLEKGAPPGAVISIACLESGFGRSYISNVTGNILSLNANENETALPPLSLPVSKNDEIIIDSEKLKNMLAKGDSVKVVNRPASLKKDYRPGEIAGTFTQLDYFLYNNSRKIEAWENNLRDFLFSRLNDKSAFAAYRETNGYCSQLYKTKKLSVLLSNDSAVKFLSMVGGRPQSFNSRDSWAEKTRQIVRLINAEIYLKKYLAVYRDRFSLADWEFDI